jgi:hypothetical protein
MNKEFELVQLAKTCEMEAARLGFYIGTDIRRQGMLCIFAADTNPHYVKGMVLQMFETYAEIHAYFSGWDEHRVFVEIGGGSDSKNPWKEAVIDELVVAHTYINVHDNNPRQAVKDAISINVAFALDPAISEAAQALVNRGVAEAMKGTAR